MQDAIQRAADRFWRRVAKADGSACWLWTGARFHFGHGAFKVAGRTLKAHRVAYVLTYGPIPNNNVVRHRCDTPPCVRPDHLLLGSQVENVADRNRFGIFNTMVSRIIRGVRWKEGV